MDTYDPRRKQKVGRARRRQMARRNRNESMAVPRQTPSDSHRIREEYRHVEVNEPRYITYLRRTGLYLQDVFWHLRNNPQTAKMAASGVAIAFVVFIAIHLLSGMIFPNVWSMGIYLGGKTVEEAQTALVNAWNDDIQIGLVVDGTIETYARPADLGLEIDAKTIAETARGIGLSGLPMGYDIKPDIAMNYLTAEQYLLNMASTVNIIPTSASYTWENGQVVGIQGMPGRELNVTATLDVLQQNLLQSVNNRRLNLTTVPIAPEYVDPEPFLEDARQIASTSFQFVGYDPFRNETRTWATAPENVVSWLQVGNGQLEIRQETFNTFIEALNDAIAAEDDQLRYIDSAIAMEQVEEALVEGEPTVYMRMSYRNEIYTVQPGDSGYRIARKKGIPFYMLQDANTGRNLESLYVGDELNIPTRDLTVPEIPVPHKRIVVDLERQWLVAFENGEEVFSWRISSGRAAAPTSPGIFQILTRNEIATGSGTSLCADGQCGRWTMYWFMGIYEVSPGLINGFHGAVELPNGTYLNGGNVDYPSTFGCVMSLDENAKKLYDWADIGTMVEIISSEFPPQSDLGREVRERQL